MRTPLTLIFALFMLTLAQLSPQATKAQTYNIQGVAALDLIQGYPVGDSHMIAARIRLKDGWKTYWRAPGGNGIPPRFTWNGSRNLGAVAFHWPAPDVYVNAGIRTIGYQNQLVLPIEITAKDPSKPVTLKGHVDFGICEEVCLPVKARFSMTVATGTTAQQSLIKQAIHTKPARKGISNLRCAIRPVEDGFRIEARMTLRRPPVQGTFAVMELIGSNTWIEEGSFNANGGQVTAVSTVYPLDDGPFFLDRSRIRLTVLGQGTALEALGCPS